jgi:8-oxo-dGTP pyrophosphatase MutT (NUDIX family)
MNYVGDLRKLVGHRPLLMVGATVLIMNNENCLLLLKRVDNKAWGPPGGAVEPGELVEDAAKRETFEETGLEIGELTLLNVFSGPEQFYRYPSGDEVYNVTIVYLCRNASGEIRLSEEHTEWQYFQLNDIPTPISPPIVPILMNFSSCFRRGEV